MLFYLKAKPPGMLFGFAFCAIWAVALYWAEPCRGQSSLSTSPAAPSAKVRWVSGPRKVSLSTVADIEIPQGYRLTDAAGARILLEAMKVPPPPDGLMGILVPDSGKCWAVLELSDIGYVKNAVSERLDTAKILKAVQDKNARGNSERNERGMKPITLVNWERTAMVYGRGETLIGMGGSG